MIQFVLSNDFFEGKIVEYIVIVLMNKVGLDKVIKYINILFNDLILTHYNKALFSETSFCCISYVMILSIILL